jgi:hypothetical protein
MKTTLRLRLNSGEPSPRVRAMLDTCRFSGSRAFPKLRDPSGVARATAFLDTVFRVIPTRTIDAIAIVQDLTLVQPRERGLSV